MKQAILAVHFGTNYPNGRAAMNSMDEAMKAVASEADFFSVTSKGLESGLSVVKKEGYTHIVVQSTYLLDGVKYRELEADTAKWRPNFTQFLLSPPLLSSTADLKHLADGLDQLYRPKNDEILVLVGHGTSCFSNVVYPGDFSHYGSGRYCNWYCGGFSKSTRCVKLFIALPIHEAAFSSPDDDSGKARL